MNGIKALAQPVNGMKVSTIFDGFFAASDTLAHTAAMLGAPALDTSETEVIYRPAIRRRIVCTP